MQNQRQIAVSILLEINQQGAYNNIALRRALGTVPNWEPHQKAFVTELVNGTLRNIILIDHIIFTKINKPSKVNKPSKINKPSKMKPFIMELLRTAVYQICWMDKVPPSAAVNEAVKLARTRGFDSLSGFVNGVLRNIVRDHENGTLPIPQSPPDDFQHMASYLSLRYSYPLWLAEKLIEWLDGKDGKDAKDNKSDKGDRADKGDKGDKDYKYGKEAEMFCAKSHIPPEVTICTNILKTTVDDLILDLEKSGIKCIKPTEPNDTFNSSANNYNTNNPCLHLKGVSDLKNLDAYKQGKFFVIDEGAYLVAKALFESKAQSKTQSEAQSKSQSKAQSKTQTKIQKIIDLCAAPGGKSFVCAGLMKTKISDIIEKKMHITGKEMQITEEKMQIIKEEMQIIEEEMQISEIISCDIHPHKIKLMKDMAKQLGANCIKPIAMDATIINPAWQEWADAVILDAPCSGFGVIRKKPDIKYTKTYEDVLTLASLQRKLLTAAAFYVKPGGLLVYSTCTVTSEENIDNVHWFLENFSQFALESPCTNHAGFFISRMRRQH